MSEVRLDGVAKRFGATAVVEQVTLTVPDGALCALLGPSGSGKTTLLRMIAGFETTDAGRILLDGEDVTAKDALERRCGMVFQHYALFPHLNVAENVGYGLAREKLGRAELAARVAEALAMVDLAGYGTRPVTALSGGQQQRVALARALAPRPRVLLLDEPLSNLDPSLRERTRHELRALVRRIGITTILVTHEQEEAFDLADTIALLHRGRLEQVGIPEALYRTPATPFTARFVGRAAELAGTVVARAGDRATVRAAGVDWDTTTPGVSGDTARLLLRPEALALDADGPLAGTVTARRFAGAVTYLTVTLAAGGEVEVAVDRSALEAGAAVRLRPTGIGAHAFPDGAA